MAGNRRRKQDNSGVHAFLYVLVVLVLLCGMGYLFYYSRSQAKERQEYIRVLESKEAATKDVVQVTVPEEPESETISEAESSTPEVQTDTQTEIESESETESHLESESETKSETESQSIASESAKSTEADLFSAENPRIIVLNGTGKAGVAASGGTGKSNDGNETEAAGLTGRADGTSGEKLPFSLFAEAGIRM